jgi:hypothetical protein
MDTQEYNERKSEWMAVLLQLWHAYNKQPNPAQVKTYVAQLGHIQFGMLEAAVAHLLANHKYNSTPTIAEVLEAVEATNRHDWRDINQYIKVYSHPNLEWYESHKVEHTPDEYRRAWLGEEVSI